MKHLVILLTVLTISHTASAPIPATVLTDEQAGYDQAAYDACMDSADEVACDA